MTSTSSPRANKRSVRWEPMKPDPPVINTFMVILLLKQYIAYSDGDPPTEITQLFFYTQLAGHEIPAARFLCTAGPRSFDHSAARYPSRAAPDDCPPGHG